MKPSRDIWRFILAVAACLATGLGAGGARAQEDEGGWFDEGEPERPELRIRGSGPYNPPPPDFSSEPARQNSESEAEAAPRESEAIDNPEDDADAHTRAVAEFSPHLTRYGYWVDDPRYGRVWVPTRSVVGSDFSPYVTGGHWELTVDDEWMWVSDYPFGWITFHYGRWAWVGGPGWVWVPGYRYAPAWVDFRIGASGYIGWGPLPAHYAWHNGAYVSIGVRRPLPFIFCPTTYVFSHSMHRHVIRDRHRVRSIAADTWRYRPNRTGSFSRVVRGPSPAEARIPRRSLPSHRTIARPRVAGSFERGGRDASATPRQQSYRGRDSAPRVDQRSLSSARRGNPSSRPSNASSMRRGTPSGSRDARPREWFDDSSGRHRAAPSRAPQRGFDNRAPAPRGSINLGRPPAKSAPKTRSQEMQLPSRAESTLRSADRQGGSQRSYAPGARSKSRSSRGASAPRTQPRTHHRAERDSRGTRR